MTSAAPAGRLAIVLHTHMPNVLGHGVWPFGEQWLWEVIVASYLRVADAVGGRAVTIGITPVLADQLEAMQDEAGDRFTAWVNDTQEYVYGEDMRSFLEVDRPDLHAALEPQLLGHRSALERFENEYARDLNGVFRGLAEQGAELLGGPATHPIMPLIASDFGRRLQLDSGLAAHARRFGACQGIWLPECAWDRGLAASLAEAGVGHCCVDQSAIYGEQSLRNMQPLATESGVTAIPIDWHTVAQVWREDGYPSLGAYRSTFRRTIHDLLPYNNDGEGWNPAAARALAESHADTFLRALAARLEVHSAETGQLGTSVFAADTELFGHWWYEGPWWLEAVVGRAADYGIELVTLGEAAEGAIPGEPGRSTWGRDKNFSTWDSPKTAEIVWAQRRAELQLEAAARSGSRHDRVAAERELLQLQASDWTFMESGGRTGDYGAQRFAGHLAAFERELSRLQG
jgi:1,4-alpha-glucan branching enzyme